MLVSQHSGVAAGVWFWHAFDCNGLCRDSCGLASCLSSFELFSGIDESRLEVRAALAVEIGHEARRQLPKCTVRCCFPLRRPPCSEGGSLQAGKPFAILA